MVISEDERASSHMTNHMSGSCLCRIEVVGGRRRWTVEQKLAMLADAFGPGGSVGAACDRHRIGSGQLYTWRRRALAGELTAIRSAAVDPAGFAEVTLSAPDFGFAPAPLSVSPVAQGPHPCGQIGIELPSGVRLTVDGTVDGDALARVLAVLGR
jgi:transposase